MNDLFDDFDRDDDAHDDTHDEDWFPFLDREWPTPFELIVELVHRGIDPWRACGPDGVPGLLLWVRPGLPAPPSLPERLQRLLFRHAAELVAILPDLPESLRLHLAATGGPKHFPRPDSSRE